MVNKPKNIGTRGETKVVNYLKEHGIQAQRRALAGNKDVGDVEYEHPSGCKCILEVKAGKQTENYSRGTKEEWLRQTREEENNSGCPAHLVIVIYGKSIANAEVWTPDGGLFWYLDQFVTTIGGKVE